MFRIISHRGLRDNLPKRLENYPLVIDKTISMGFDVEVDIRAYNNDYYLGHDTGDYKIDLHWIVDRREKIWFHTKNCAAAYSLSQIPYRIKYFSHTSDPFSLINGGYLWCHDRKLATNNKCLTHLINKKDIENWHKYRNIMGIITDYPILLKQLMNE